MYAALFVVLQKTIDGRAKYYPELVRTLKQIQEAPGDTVHFVPLNAPNIKEFLQRAVISKEGLVEADLAYCANRLRDPSITHDEQEVVRKSQQYRQQQISERG